MVECFVLSAMSVFFGKIFPDNLLNSCKIHKQNHISRKFRVFDSKIPHFASQSVQFQRRITLQINFATVSILTILQSHGKTNIQFRDIESQIYDLFYS